jgi:hypothetical protein
MGHLLDDRRMKLFRSRNLALRLTLFVFTFVSLLVISFATYSPFRQQVMLRVPRLLHDLYSTAEAHRKPAEFMSAEDVFQYLHWSNCAACQVPVDFGFVMARSGNPGGVAHPDGQKLVCLDQYIAPVYNNCHVYSFGINNQWTFDEDMAQFGCHVYSFDPSMGANDHNRTSKIHFFNLGLAKENGQSPNGWKMKTASSIYEMLADYHGSSTLIDVFKMDIEFYEWEVIPQMVQSGFLRDKVKQLDSFLIILQRIVDILISTILWRITRNESASFKILNRWIKHLPVQTVIRLVEDSFVSVRGLIRGLNDRSKFLGTRMTFGDLN